MNLQMCLDEMGIRYHMSFHRSVYTAQELAAAEHIPGRRVIKPVLVQADGQLVMCALPASHRIDLNELANQLEVANVALIEESRIPTICGECELGAEPPVGRLFGIPTVMDESLLADDRVMFQAGTHNTCVTMTMADYRRLAQPEIAHFGRHL